LLHCVGEVSHRNRQPVDDEVALFRETAGDLTPRSNFLNSVTPGQMSFNFPNLHYSSHAAYLDALATAMKVEYEAIAAAGVTLQLDSPDSAMAAHCHAVGTDVGDFKKHLEMAIEALNGAVANIPSDQLRFHVCWGNYIGPHHKDVGLGEVLPLVFRSKASVISFEAANPRHAHEWQVFRDLKVPDDKVIMPGVIDVKTQYIEHPDLVAQRIEAFANLVGKERVIAATDCGLSTYAGWTNVYPDIAWAKLNTLVEGARIASDRLF
jgi:5-methyltetrahydropteroyltriglutamate--homocysteine methyltransferase